MHFREARWQASSARRRAGTFGIGRESWPARSACATDARYLPGMPATLAGLLTLIVVIGSLSGT
jgi:hypothetical protein